MIQPIIKELKGKQIVFSCSMISEIKNNLENWIQSVDKCMEQEQNILEQLLKSYVSLKISLNDSAGVNLVVSKDKDEDSGEKIGIIYINAKHFLDTYGN